MPHIPGMKCNGTIATYNTIGAQQGTKVRHEAQLLARKHVEELTRQGKSVEDLGRGLMKYLKEANDD
eukprot:1157466-Pelagomonas_calceolata.AAC.3